MKPYLLLFRAWNALFAAVVCLCSFFIAKNNFLFGCEEILLSLGIFFLVAFANAHNDITDFEIDKINRPNRPLPSGKISFKQARMAAFASVFAAIILGAVVGIEFALLFAATGALCFVYNRFLKGLPLAGNFAVALLTCVAIITPIIKLGLPQPKLAALSYFAFMLTFAREITKDIEDMEGDKSLGLKTFPILLGINPSVALVFIFELACLALLAVLNPLSLIGVAPCLVLSAVFACLKRWGLSQNMLKLAMAAGLAFFFLNFRNSP